MSSNFDSSNSLLLLKIISNLKKTKRSGWVVSGIKDAESIAEHTFSTALLALIFSNNSKLSKDKLIKMALVHDLAESLTGDLITEGSVILATKEDKYKKEKEAMNKIASLLDKGDEWFNLWQEYEMQSSEEAKFLKELDKFDMIIQALEYKDQLEENRFKEFWDNGKKYISDIRLLKILDELQQITK